MKHLFANIPISLAILLIASCSAPISVKTVRPPEPAGMQARPATLATRLDAIRGLSSRIASGDPSALPAYNYSVSRLVEDLEASGADPWSAPLEVGGIRLVGRTDPLAHQVIPADTLEFEGDYASHRAAVGGLGAPVVEVTSYAGIGHQEIRSKLPIRNLVAIVRFSGNTATLELVDPYQTESVAFGGRRFDLAADYGASAMLALSKARVDKLGLARLLRPSRYNDTAHLNFVQPYDPDRIPVLMIHGLQDTPASFAPLYFSLLEDPVIRKNYQFWVFSYPSGYPYPYSASLLRGELDDVAKQHPDHKDMVIIGHSMGSLISRLMVTDAGDRIWIKAFGKPPSETHFTGHSREILESAIVFNHRREIDRAIFISGPHRGSVLASNWIGAISTRLVRLPKFMADVRDSAISVATADASGLMLQRAPNSIDTLSPNNLFVRQINQIPISPGVPYHSIIGDRGKPGPKEDSSDGVVAYWSSHLDGAESEKLVPSGHGAHQSPEGIEEVRRILLLHLKNR